MMAKPVLKVKYKYEEVIRILENNELEKLKCILENGKSLIIQNCGDENDFFKLCIKYCNLPALHLAFDLILNSSCYKQSSNQNSILQLLQYTLVHGDVSFFIYITKRFNISYQHFSKSFVEEIFNSSHLDIISYLLCNTNFKYKLSKNMILCESNSSDNANPSNIIDDDLCEFTGFASQQLHHEKWIYFNCLDREYFTEEDEEKGNIVNLDPWIVRDKLHRIAFLRSMKFFLIKHKSPFSLPYSPEQQKKILSYI